MPRELKLDTLNAYARAWAVWWIQGHQTGRPDRDRHWLRGQLYNLAYRDEFDAVAELARDRLAGADRTEFDAMANALRAEHPRGDEVFAAELAARLAIDPEGLHVKGRRGTVRIASRRLGNQVIEVETIDSVRRRRFRRRAGVDPGPRLVEKIIAPLDWPVYAGEAEERERIAARARGFVEGGADRIDELPPLSLTMALAARIANVIAIDMLNAAVDRVDSGTGAGIVQGFSGAQPADPDTAATGTLLHENVMADPAFGAASDNNPGAIATAGAIAGTTALATNTVGYGRISSTNDGATPLDDLFDGSAGTADANYIYNTTAIVTGADVDVTSLTVTQPESS